MLILGIETSCDETSAAIIENGTKILSNIIASSQKLHIKTGGIIPEMAAREQIKCIIPVIQKALSQAHLDYQDIDVLAVTTGPGLIGSLLVGVETAKTLAYLWNKPIVPINHLLAHVYANWLNNNLTIQQFNNSTKILESDHYNNIYYHSKNNLPKFPLIALIVSGGHTELILMKDHGKYQWLGGTRDDASGECFDKISRLLELGYPGGPAIAVAAAVILGRSETTTPESNSEQARMTSKIHLPRPMINSDDFDFSFSGLKTAVFREVSRLKTIKQFNNLTIQQLAFEVQEAIIDVLVVKTLKAAREKNVKTILLSGGVAANQRLRKKMLKYSSNEVRSSLFARTINNDLKVFFPEPKLCTDNAASIASCAFFNYKPVPWQKIQVNPSLSL